MLASIQAYFKQNLYTMLASIRSYFKKCNKTNLKKCTVNDVGEFKRDVSSEPG